MSFLDPECVEIFIEITDDDEECPDYRFARTIYEELEILADEVAGDLEDNEELVAGCSRVSTPTQLIFGWKYVDSSNGEKDTRFFHVHSNGNVTPGFGGDPDRVQQFHERMDLDIEDLPNLDLVEKHWEDVKNFLREEVENLMQKQS